MSRILFVCMGNICRSPLAEGIARARATRLPPGFTFDSAGIESYHVGDPPDPRARALARERGTPIDDLRARQVSAQDFARFDLILACDRRNLRALRAMRSGDAGAELDLLLDYGTDSRDAEVPDPYYGDARDFVRVYDMLDAAMPELLARASTLRRD